MASVIRLKPCFNSALCQICSLAVFISPAMAAADGPAGKVARPGCAQLSNPAVHARHMSPIGQAPDPPFCLSAGLQRNFPLAGQMECSEIWRSEGR
jgi:hypothetical protein